MTREEYVTTLRALADYFEQHPELPAPSAHEDRLTINVFTADLEKVARVGSFDKSADGIWFNLKQHVAYADIVYYNYRDAVCTKRVVGTEKVTEKVPTAFEEREVEHEIVEWDCPPLLAKVKEGPRAD